MTHVRIFIEAQRTVEMNLLSWVDIQNLIACIHGSGIISKKDLFMRSFRLLCRYGKVIPFVGNCLASVEVVLPNADSKKLVRLVENLSEQIQAVKHELLNEIKFEAMKLQYGDSVTKIETGVEFLSKILNSSNGERKRFEERLKELCSGQEMAQAVRKFLNGLTGESLLHNDILETIYRVARGHREINEKMHNQFLQLVNGGLAVIAAYETLVRGKEGALEMQTLFEGDIEILKTRFEEFRRRAFRDNVLTDLNKVLDSNISNKDAVSYLGKSLQEDYNWMETYCIVCKESIFADYDFTGDHVKSLKRNGRFGVIFYREKPEGPVSRKILTKILQEADWPEELKEVFEEIDNDLSFSNAARRNSVLNASFSRNGFSLWGCATVQISRFIVFFPVINILFCILFEKALNSFETPTETDETSKAVLFDGEGRRYLCLVMA